MPVSAGKLGILGLWLRLSVIWCRNTFLLDSLNKWRISFHSSKFHCHDSFVVLLIIMELPTGATCGRQHPRLHQIRRQWKKYRAAMCGRWRMSCMNLQLNNFILCRKK
uniref:Putative secreted protein n=1 Tax=Nyssomyia neivai TaxID=330878 RepID=A0A1L8DNN6_9DIPT